MNLKSGKELSASLPKSTTKRPPMTRMILKLARVSIPAIITQVFAMFMEIVNLYFIGHLNDPEKVAGVGLGNMYVNIICQSVIIGLNGGIGTLVAQAYG